MIMESEAKPDGGIYANKELKMTTEYKEKQVPWILWPFWAIWRLIALIVSLTGRLLAVILGLLIAIVGVILTVTVILAPIGIPLILFGGLLVIRGLF